MDDPFRGTSQPAYSSGTYEASGGYSGGGLKVLVGGVNDDDILGMSGGWQQSFNMSTSAEVTLSFRYQLTLTSEYEIDEYGQALVSVDGTLYGEGANDYVYQITGNGNGGSPDTSGWRLFTVNLGILSAGSHTLVIGGYNNKKTFNDESVEVLIDDVLVAPTVNVLEAHFDTDEEGFTYGDDPFRNTSEPAYASGDHVACGGYGGGRLRALLGGINDDDIFGMSGGWQKIFNMSTSADATLSFRYNLTLTSEYEIDEYGQVLVGKF